LTPKGNSGGWERTRNEILSENGCIDLRSECKTLLKVGRGRSDREA
jgi:hypothetical protein